MSHIQKVCVARKYVTCSSSTSAVQQQYRRSVCQVGERKCNREFRVVLVDEVDVVNFTVISVENSTGLWCEQSCFFCVSKS